MNPSARYLRAVHETRLVLHTQPLMGRYTDRETLVQDMIHEHGLTGDEKELFRRRFAEPRAVKT